jgi:hypothetical protein
MPPEVRCHVIPFGLLADHDQPPALDVKDRLVNDPGWGLPRHGKPFGATWPDIPFYGVGPVAPPVWQNGTETGFTSYCRVCGRTWTTPTDYQNVGKAAGRQYRHSTPKAGDCTLIDLERDESVESGARAMSEKLIEPVINAAVGP